MALRDDLYDLIRSMTPSEKRYFKIHADKHTSTDYKSQYEKLFDALNTWPAGEYDEKEFKKKNKGRGFLKHLSTEKAYLYDLILRTLLNYHSGQSPEMRLQEMILHIRLLIDRGLKAQAHRLISRAEQIALDTEQLNEVLTLNDCLLMLYRMAPAESPYQVQEIVQQGRDILGRIELTRRAIYLRIQMVDIDDAHTWELHRDLSEQIYTEAQQLAGRPGLTRKAALSLLNVQQLYLVHHHRYRESMILTEGWIDQMAADKTQVLYSTVQRLFILANYLMCALHCEELDRLPQGISAIRAIKAKNENQEADCFRLTAQYEILYMMNTADYNNADLILREIDAGLKKYKDMIPERQLVNFRFNTVLLHFLRKDYDQALTRLHLLHEVSGRDERYVPTTVMGRIIEWMCHASLANRTLLDNQLRSLRKYCKDRKITNGFFDTIFDCFGMIIKEAGIKPASRVSIKEHILHTSAPPDWEQIKAIILSWLS